jgi:hypothetical protein
MTNRIRTILTITLALSLLAPLATAETYDLKQKVQPGTSWLVNSTVMDNKIQGGPQGNMQQKMRMLMVVKMEVGQPGPDGKMPVKLSYERIAQHMSMMGMNMSYDSDQAEGQNSSPTAPMFKAMIDAPLEMKITPDGKVSDITGIDEMINAMGSNPQIAAAAQQMVSPEAMEKMINSSAAYLPDKPVAVGETWTRTETVPMPMGGALKMNMNFKLEQVRGDIAEIALDGTFNADEAKQNLPQQIEIKELVGSQKGKIMVDRKTGQFESNKLNQTMNMTMAMTSPQGQAMTMTTQQNTVQSMKRLDKRDKAMEEKLLAEANAKLGGNANQAAPPAPAE